MNVENSVECLTEAGGGGEFEVFRRTLNLKEMFETALNKV